MPDRPTPSLREEVGVLKDPRELLNQLFPGADLHSSFQAVLWQIHDELTRLRDENARLTADLAGQVAYTERECTRLRAEVVRAQEQQVERVAKDGRGLDAADLPLEREITAFCASMSGSSCEESGMHRICEHKAIQMADQNDALRLAEEGIEGVIRLFDDGLLVRSTTNDAHLPSYLAESGRLVNVLATFKDTLAAIRAAREGK